MIVSLEENKTTTQTTLEMPVVEWDTCFSPDTDSTLLEDLILEHFTGRHDGFLKLALDFVQSYQQTHGECPDEEILEEGLAEGFGEEEIAAALHLLLSRSIGEQFHEVAPLWADYVGI